MLLKNMFKFFNLFFSYTNSIDLFIIFSFFIIWLFPLFFSIINKNNLKKVILIFNVFLKKLLVICISFIFYDYFFYCFDLEPSLYFLFELLKKMAENEVINVNNEEINKKIINEFENINKKNNFVYYYFSKKVYSLILYYMTFYYLCYIIEFFNIIIHNNNMKNMNDLYLKYLETLSDKSENVDLEYYSKFIIEIDNSDILLLLFIFPLFVLHLIFKYYFDNDLEYKQFKEYMNDSKDDDKDSFFNE